jgi:hypothetical protein
VSSPFVGAERRRAMELLAPERTGVILDVVDAEPAADLLGAAEAFGLIGRDLGIRVNIYIYEGWGEGTEHLATLEAIAKADGRHHQTAVNGASLFFGSTGMNDMDGHFLLNDLMSAFAGWE